MCYTVYAKRDFTIVHLLLLLLPVEETKLKNRSTINHDIAHVGLCHWWLVHRHKILLLTPSCDTDDYLSRPVHYNARIKGIVTKKNELETFIAVHIRDMHFLR